MHFGSATRPSQRPHSAFRDRRRDCIKALDALFSDQGTLHLALPPLPTLLIGLDCPKKRPEALRSRLRPWLRFGGIRAPKKGWIASKNSVRNALKRVYEGRPGANVLYSRQKWPKWPFLACFRVTSWNFFRNFLFLFSCLNWLFVYLLLLVS